MVAVMPQRRVPCSPHCQKGNLLTVPPTKLAWRNRGPYDPGARNRSLLPAHSIALCLRKIQVAHAIDHSIRRLGQHLLLLILEGYCWSVEHVPETPFGWSGSYSSTIPMPNKLNVIGCETGQNVWCHYSIGSVRDHPYGIVTKPEQSGWLICSIALQTAWVFVPRSLCKTMEGLLMPVLQSKEALLGGHFRRVVPVVGRRVLVYVSAIH
jgi:hypothetical protein